MIKIIVRSIRAMNRRDMEEITLLIDDVQRFNRLIDGNVERIALSMARTGEIPALVKPTE